MSTMPRPSQDHDPFRLINVQRPVKPLLAVTDSMQFIIDRIGSNMAGGDDQDEAGIPERELWAGRYVAALHMLIMLPFCRLHDIAETCGCSIDEAATTVSDLLRDPEAARMLEEFRGDIPYRRITIQPIVEYGAVEAFLKGTYRYPFTVGIYPAVTCMLSCAFCGRARGAKYKQEDIEPGNELLAQLFAEAPRDLPRRFYLSGGLEPLTNPGLAKLVSFAASLGHRMQLYTNGMMLTPQFLSNNEGLWDLETVRISMYGADDETAQFTTSRSGVATRVLANARDFVRAKSERRATLRVGFNHVVQTGQVAHLRKIAAAIVSIADQSPDRKGVNLLTLRENYAASGGAAIRGDERKQLRDELIALQQFFVAEGMADLEVDLGYGMRGLVEGCETEPVRQVAHTEMLGRGYPQISVVVDLLGDVYLYREAAFIGREGADRYIIGRVTPNLGLAEILQRYCAEREHHTVVPRPGDELFLDAFDHAVTAFLRQAGDDLHFGTGLSGIPIPNNPYLVPNNLWR
jgi:dTDP-4-amino-4,6-dideoxy-D-glucose ammonia-lyase